MATELIQTNIKDHILLHKEAEVDGEMNAHLLTATNPFLPSYLWLYA